MRLESDNARARTHRTTYSTTNPGARNRLWPVRSYQRIQQRPALEVPSHPPPPQKGTEPLGETPVHGRPHGATFALVI
jgi:hypothetical protein